MKFHDGRQQNDGWVRFRWAAAGRGAGATREQTSKHRQSCGASNQNQPRPRNCGAKAAFRCSCHRPIRRTTTSIANPLPLSSGLPTTRTSPMNQTLTRTIHSMLSENGFTESRELGRYERACLCLGKCELLPREDWREQQNLNNLHLLLQPLFRGIFLLFGSTPYSLPE